MGSKGTNARPIELNSRTSAPGLTSHLSAADSIPAQLTGVRALPRRPGPPDTASDDPHRLVRSEPDIAVLAPGDGGVGDGVPGVGQLQLVQAPAGKRPPAVGHVVQAQQRAERVPAQYRQDAGI